MWAGPTGPVYTAFEMTKTITSSVPFQDPQGNILAKGSMTLDIIGPVQILSGGGQVVPTRVSINLTSSGTIPAATIIWANDELTPSNTVYIVNIFNSNGLLVSGPLIWSITGASPIDLSQETPVSFATLSFSLPGMNSQVFTISGTFTIPATVNKVKVTVVGAGGAGGGSNGANAGAGGGAGGMAIKWLSGLTPGNTLTVTIGAGGTGVSAANGNPGNPSSVASGTQTISTITGNGGGFGSGNAGANTGGGNGASATGGDINVTGSQAPGLWGTGMGNDGANSVYGAGGFAITNQAGQAAQGFGSGGGGAQGTGPFAGGNGAPGIVVFEWVA